MTADLVVPPEAYEPAVHAVHDIECPDTASCMATRTSWARYERMAHAAVDAAWPILRPLAVAEGRRLELADQASGAIGRDLDDQDVAELATHPLADVWNAAISVSTSQDFRTANGELNEDAYLRYMRNVFTRVHAEVLAQADMARWILREIGEDSDA